MKILIADDDHVSRTLVKSIIRRFAPVVFDAENGLDALSLVERKDPDILITDLNMPVFDGFELIAALRASPEHERLPIICLSSVNDRDEIARLAAIGITDYLCKPPQAAELLRRFDRIVREQSQWKTHRASYDASAQASTVFLIDRDADYRAFVRSVLEPTFSVTEAATGADGLRDLRALTTLPAIVLVADGLQLLPAEAIPPLVRRVVSERGARQPAILLLTESDSVPPEKEAKFNGIIHKSLGAAEFASALEAARSGLAPGRVTGAVAVAAD